MKKLIALLLALVMIVSMTACGAKKVEGEGDATGIPAAVQLRETDALKGKKVGYAAGTSSENILNTALASVGLTMDDIVALSMDADALTTAALSNQVDAVAAWSPMSLTILEKGNDVTDACCRYLAPIIEGELPLTYEGGLPKFFRFD